LNFPYFLNIVYVTFIFPLTAEHMAAAAVGAILFVCILNVLETQHVKPW